MFMDTDVLVAKKGYGDELEEGFGRRGDADQQFALLWLELWKLDVEARYEEYPVDQYAISARWLTRPVSAY